MNFYVCNAREHRCWSCPWDASTDNLVNSLLQYWYLSHGDFSVFPQSFSLIHTGNFLFQLLYFPVLEFPFGSLFLLFLIYHYQQIFRHVINLSHNSCLKSLLANSNTYVNPKMTIGLHSWSLTLSKFLFLWYRVAKGLALARKVLYLMSHSLQSNCLDSFFLFFHVLTLMNRSHFLFHRTLNIPGH